MPSYDQTSAECAVLTFKEGLLSPVAHDLRLTVTRFRVEVTDASVTARFDTASLRVDAPMKDGLPNPSALSPPDREKIEEQIREEVLHARRFPEATFTSSSVVPRADGGYDLTGNLSLHGVTQVLHARTQLRDGRQQLELTLHQPDFGITPFKAMLGTLKIRPDVVVRLQV